MEEIFPIQQQSINYLSIEMDALSGFVSCAELTGKRQSGKQDHISFTRAGLFSTPVIITADIRARYPGVFGHIRHRAMASSSCFFFLEKFPIRTEHTKNPALALNGPRMFPLHFARKHRGTNHFFCMRKASSNVKRILLLTHRFGG